MSKPFNLSEITAKYAKARADNMDSGLAQYVRSSIELLQAQGKDITEYTLTQIDTPMQVKDNEYRAGAVWKIMRMDELEIRPTFGGSDE